METFFWFCVGYTVTNIIILIHQQIEFRQYLKSLEEE